MSKSNQDKIKRSGVDKSILDMKKAAESVKASLLDKAVRKESDFKKIGSKRGGIVRAIWPMKKKVVKHFF